MQAEEWGLRVPAPMWNCQCDCGPIVGNSYLEISSCLPVIRPQSLAREGELHSVGLTRPVIALNPDLGMRVVSTPGMHF